MIYIAKNSLNNIVLTLTESSSLSSPYYLFEFISDWQLGDNKTSLFFTTPDVSLFQDRYNLFHLYESPTGSTSGGINLPLNLENGQYSYNVYESSAQTISISATTGVVIESGRMVVGDVIKVLNDNTNNSPQLGVYD